MTVMIQENTDAERKRKRDQLTERDVRTSSSELIDNSYFFRDDPFCLEVFDESIRGRDRLFRGERSLKGKERKRHEYEKRLEHF